MKSRSLNNSTKKVFDFDRNVTTFRKVPLTPCFPSSSITKKAETNRSPMRDLIIEQPPYQTIDWNV